MRAMVLGYLSDSGFTPRDSHEPDVLLGRTDRHEVRVELAYDGTVNRAHWRPTSDD